MQRAGVFSFQQAGGMWSLAAQGLLWLIGMDTVSYLSVSLGLSFF
jgi:hypothetical protein